MSDFFIYLARISGKVEYILIRYTVRYICSYERIYKLVRDAAFHAKRDAVGEADHVFLAEIVRIVKVCEA